MTMQPHQVRVVEEKAELDEKLTKLTDFLTTEFCLSLPFKERGRLKQQHSVMTEYSSVLGERISAFGTGKP